MSSFCLQTTCIMRGGPGPGCTGHISQLCCVLCIVWASASVAHATVCTFFHRSFFSHGKSWPLLCALWSKCQQPSPLNHFTFHALLGQKGAIAIHAIWICQYFCRLFPNSKKGCRWVWAEQGVWCCVVSSGPIVYWRGQSITRKSNLLCYPVKCSFVKSIQF